MIHELLAVPRKEKKRRVTLRAYEKKLAMVNATIKARQARKGKHMKLSAKSEAKEAGGKAKISSSSTTSITGAASGNVNVNINDVILQAHAVEAHGGKIKAIDSQQQQQKTEIELLKEQMEQTQKENAKDLQRKEKELSEMAARLAQAEANANKAAAQASAAHEQTNAIFQTVIGPGAGGQVTKAVKTRKGAEVTVKNEGFEDFASAVVPEMEDHGMQIAALREELAAMKANQKKNQRGRCLIS